MVQKQQKLIKGEILVLQWNLLFTVCRLKYVLFSLVIDVFLLFYSFYLIFFLELNDSVLAADVRIDDYVKKIDGLNDRIGKVSEEINTKINFHNSCDK